VDVAEDAGGHQVELDGRDLGSCPELRRHRRDEVTHPGGRLDDTWAIELPEAELLDGLPDRGDDIEWRIEGGQRGDPEVTGIVRGQERGVAVVQYIAASTRVVAEQPVQQRRFAEGAVVSQDQPLLVRRRAALSL
jgi:hypothetical protein